MKWRVVVLLYARPASQESGVRSSGCHHVEVDLDGPSAEHTTRGGAMMMP